MCDSKAPLAPMPMSKAPMPMSMAPMPMPMAPMPINKSGNTLVPAPLPTQNKDADSLLSPSPLTLPPPLLGKNESKALHISLSAPVLPNSSDSLSEAEKLQQQHGLVFEESDDNFSGTRKEMRAHHLAHGSKLHTHAEINNYVKASGLESLHNSPRTVAMVDESLRTMPSKDTSLLTIPKSERAAAMKEMYSQMHSRMEKIQDTIQHQVRNFGFDLGIDHLTHKKHDGAERLVARFETLMNPARVMTSNHERFIPNSVGTNPFGIKDHGQIICWNAATAAMCGFINESMNHGEAQQGVREWLSEIRTDGKQANKGGAHDARGFAFAFAKESGYDVSPVYDMTPSKADLKKLTTQEKIDQTATDKANWDKILKEHVKPGDIIYDSTGSHVISYLVKEDGLLQVQSNAKGVAKRDVQITSVDEITPPKQFFICRPNSERLAAQNEEISPNDENFKGLKTTTQIHKDLTFDQRMAIRDIGQAMQLGESGDREELLEFAFSRAYKKHEHDIDYVKSAVSLHAKNADDIVKNQMKDFWELDFLNEGNYKSALTLLHGYCNLDARESK
ncbi:hypothetical protein [Thalassomonas actiniarum]|uniref:Uncharacterized protein n=1 Tax=Thalassomonas actiniarum TaxID=485447 RepID=A0AAE9YZW1_9GAMM|nr:hypothetical protein [Thalassomonas actiniarum]WDE02603.1 hypothetical protein SG35_029815 [Thalassomonas actiniarum]